MASLTSSSSADRGAMASRLDGKACEALERETRHSRSAPVVPAHSWIKVHKQCRSMVHDQQSTSDAGTEALRWE